jgi:hypothetical protein
MYFSNPKINRKHYRIPVCQMQLMIILNFCSSLKKKQDDRYDQS